ncbi:translesion DNA synthesis-associated protein ImuA [Lysobacter sp. BMK333-48F3]|nr:translesion DNA synthesis-associated protein ImuA [Lysobacter sp. BMK333-48F3]
MGKLVALDGLIDARRLWRGQPAQRAPSSQPTGLAELDAALPSGGWPEAALSELLLPMPGVGELELLWPALARLSQAQSSQAQSSQAARMIALVDPPLLPYAPAWRNAGVSLSRLQWVRASAREALWAAEQCLRSGACAAVLCWPQRADDRALRRLQVAAETGQCLGFVMRDAGAARNASPAALRIAIDAAPRQLRVLKCRGGNAPTRPIAFPHASHADLAPAAGPIRLDDRLDDRPIAPANIGNAGASVVALPRR